MTPREALQVLYTASERALMRGQDHATVQQAVAVLREEIKNKDEGKDK